MIKTLTVSGKWKGFEIVCSSEVLVGLNICEAYEYSSVRGKMPSNFIYSTLPQILRDESEMNYALAERL